MAEENKTHSNDLAKAESATTAMSNKPNMDDKKSGTPKGQNDSQEDKQDSNADSSTRSGSGSTRRRKSDRAKKTSRRDSRKAGRERSEFEQRIIGIRRVTRVVSGGRRFSFSVAIVVGDRKGRVGVGLGKSTDTSLAIDKAVRDAKKNMIKINFTEDNSVPYELPGKFKASIVEIRPAPGRGLVAGSSIRDVLDLAGAQNISAKLLSRSKNKINNARCAIKALEPISTRARVSLSDDSRRSGRGRGSKR